MPLENDDERRGDGGYVCEDNDLVDEDDDVHVHHGL